MKPFARRTPVVLLICVACTLLFAFLWFRGFTPLRQVELYTEDLQVRLGRKTPWDNRLALIGIDQQVYASTDFSAKDIQEEPALGLIQQNFPWSRAVWARLIQKLSDAGAKVIVYDLVFAAPGQGDEELKQALEKYGDRVVIGYNINVTKTERRNFLELQLPDSDVINSRGTNSPVEDTRLGYVNIWPDDDGTLRRAYYRQKGDQVGDILPPNVVLESLDARVLRAFGRPELIPPGFEGWRFRYTAPPGTFKPARIGDVLSPRIWAANFHNGADFKGKIVFIGPTSVLFNDLHDTPFVDPKAMPGPEIHLNIINAALHGEFLGEPSALAQFIVIVLAGIIAAAIASFLRQPFKRFIALLILVAAYAELSRIVFARAGGSAQVLLTATPILVLLLSGIIGLTYDYFLERREKRRVRKTLERYVSRDVVKELLDNPETFFNARAGVRRAVTILFCDVRGFTTLTESANESQLVQQLNEYFETWVQTVFEHAGSLDKFIGDAVMAVWGNIPTVSRGDARDAQNAVATALKMKPKLAALNENWRARGWKEFHIGVGINHGEVIVGEIGSSQKAEFTAIGDAVNLASRLEGLTKKYHVDLLLGETMARLVGDTYILRTVALIQVKGKTKSVDTFTVIGDGAAQTVSLPVWLARYEEGVRLYRAREFSQAAAEFKECLQRKPDDYLSARYLGLCEALIKDPPDDSWTAAEIMTDK
ncbi:MAG TPA: adenylate/guanylate cyclase domain-containing protein [Verrucomicrobiae bacterium]